MALTYFIVLLAATLTLFGISTAEAVMPPKVYEQARAQATYHLQVRVIRVTPPMKTPGECGITGDVVRIFRDRRASLKLGTRLVFTVSCARRGDPPIVGGTLWTDYDRLMNAKYLEVFLNQVDGRYEVALSQSRIIEAPTADPAFDPPASVGVATLERDGAIVLELRANDGIHGHARLVYPPTHPEYAEILRHLNGLKPGEQKLVSPWPDQPGATPSR